MVVEGSAGGGAQAGPTDWRQTGGVELAKVAASGGAEARQTELAAALSILRQEVDVLEQGVALIFKRLEPVLPTSYGKEPAQTGPDVPGGPLYQSMRALEVGELAERVSTAAGKLAGIREAVEV